MEYETIGDIFALMPFLLRAGCVRKEYSVLAEEFVVLDGESPLWIASRSLLDIALRLDQQEDYVWHGWKRSHMNAFLQKLPKHCSLLVGVWQEGNGQEQTESLVLGVVCEVRDGEVCSLRTFSSLVDESLPETQQLEPGYQHALELMRVAREQVAPVAWALFTDKYTWDEWLFAEKEGEQDIDKGELLAVFASEGRCVLMGSQAAHYHHHL
jgi:hypothetical protein